MCIFTTEYGIESGTAVTDVGERGYRLFWSLKHSAVHLRVTEGEVCCYWQKSFFAIDIRWWWYNNNRQQKGDAFFPPGYGCRSMAFKTRKVSVVVVRRHCRSSWRPLGKLPSFVGSKPCFASTATVASSYSSSECQTAAAAYLASTSIAKP